MTDGRGLDMLPSWRDLLTDAQLDEARSLAAEPPDGFLTSWRAQEVDHWERYGVAQCPAYVRGALQALASVNNALQIRTAVADHEHEGVSEQTIQRACSFVDKRLVAKAVIFLGHIDEGESIADLVQWCTAEPRWEALIDGVSLLYHTSDQCSSEWSARHEPRLVEDKVLATFGFAALLTSVQLAAEVREVREHPEALLQQFDGDPAAAGLVYQQAVTLMMDTACRVLPPPIFETVIK